MASRIYHLLRVFLIVILSEVFPFNVVISSTLMYPLTCSNKVQACTSYLYHISRGQKLEQIASLYSVNTSQIKPITHGTKEDYLVSVPCTCQDVGGTSGYFYDTRYSVRSGDTFENITREFYSGQVLKVGGEKEKFVNGSAVTLHLICGCVERESQEVVTYTVQKDDTLSGIAEIISTTVTTIENFNTHLTKDPSYIDVGWVLFVPREKRGTPAPRKRKRNNWTAIISILSAVTLISAGMLIIFFLRRKRTQGKSEEEPIDVIKRPSAKRITLQNQFQRKDIEDVTSIESEKPVRFSLEEIAEATSHFNGTRKIGEGGYGSVYFGVLGEREVAVKKMKSNKSKEFLAELNVLCKIHHINVVELLGYASGDNHLYVVYEYVRNGSLNEHLHDPLLKGQHPLSWTARAQIALDAARGIEYIHDHTKAHYVHRDIKTSNILLDERLGAKVADFGLAKLVEHSNEKDFIATRLVGTPGYLPPKSISELQTTYKTDVFAFGVVLAELITGQRALARDNQEPKKMKSLVSLMYATFHDKDPETAVKANIDVNLRGSYPAEEVQKVCKTTINLAV
ncbi:LysM domain receptor-like kinase [Actinidia chinensis var. chinensis]|uniref:LysM domain receptor-like kinase n=1 Tax=Actinidia chinensis var. chinensis TaxID=1590841 RepID=A0A2R6PE20_ACTCC|nr:LysM domain receptor-like kinase [Actinidia chinensis var. chinensis]